MIIFLLGAYSSPAKEKPGPVAANIKIYTHTGVFSGIPATCKTVSIDEVTLVRMSNRKIAEERDFSDNMIFMTQLGLMPAAGK